MPAFARRIAFVAALLLTAGAAFAQTTPAAEPAHTATLGAASLGLLLAVIQLIVGLSLAAFAITNGLKLVSSLLGGINLWAEIKNKNFALALLGAGIVISYTRVIGGGIAAMTSSLDALVGGSIKDGVVGLVAGLINLGVAIALASFAITVVFKVMDKLTGDIDEKKEFAAGNTAIGILYCGILIGVSGLVAAGVSGIGAGVNVFLGALVSTMGN